METILLAVAVFGIAFVGMAIGVIISNRSIKGSCGGIGAIFGSSACEICEKKNRCQETGKELCEEGE